MADCTLYNGSLSTQQVKNELIIRLVSSASSAASPVKTGLYPATYKLVSCHLQACFLPPTSLFPAHYKLENGKYKLVSCPLQACEWKTQIKAFRLNPFLPRQLKRVLSTENDIS